tara:strand:+ start:154 stop:2208 length:2055 start_codon:yes stop_codon:yes gene_type:complete
MVSASATMVLKPKACFRAFILCVATACLPTTVAQAKDNVAAVADKIFVNGHFYSADDKHSMHEAMAISGDTIIAVGNIDAVEVFSGPKTERIDLDGKLVLPGLHDTHLHPISAMPVESCDLKNEPTPLAHITEHIQDCIKKLPMDHHEWIVVNTWNFAAGNQAGEKFQTIRQALDAVQVDKPVILIGSDGHHYGVNSTALARAKNISGETVGITAKTLATGFQGIAGYIGVDQAGEPNGRLTEDYPLVAIEASNYFELGIEERRAAPELLMEVTLPRGITSFLDAGAHPPTLDIYDSLIEKNGFHARATLAIFLDPQTYKGDDKKVDYTSMIQDADAIRQKYDSVPNIKATYLKLLADGVLEGDPLATPPTLPNAAFSRNYHRPIFEYNETSGMVDVVGYADTNSPACQEAKAAKTTGLTVDINKFTAAHSFDPRQCDTNNGVLQHDLQIIKDYIREGDAAGYTMFIHAIGDRTVNITLDAIQNAKIKNGSNTKHIITHLHMVQPSDFPRFAELDVYSSFTFAWAYTDKEYDLTIIPFTDRVDQQKGLYDPSGYYYSNAYPARSIRDSGGIILSGSDAPVDTADPRPFVNIEGAVNRTLDGGQLNAMQTLSIYDAIDSYTINAARALDQSEIVGSLEAGKKADFIILNQDIIDLAKTGQSSRISNTIVLETWFAGQKVYQYKTQ